MVFFLELFFNHIFSVILMKVVIPESCHSHKPRDGTEFTIIQNPTFYLINSLKISIPIKVVIPMKMGILAKNPYHATNPPKNNPTYLPKPKFLTKKMFSCIIDLIKFIFYSITMKKLTRLFSLVTSFVLLFSSF